MTSFLWAQAASTGPSHTAAGAPCQDALSVRTFADRDGNAWIAAAVADGAGSATHSQFGSQYITDCFTQFMSEAIAETDTRAKIDLSDLVRRGVSLVRSVLVEVSENKHRLLVDYATTLLVCVSDGNRIALAQIGDGAIVLGIGRNRRVAFKPQHGDFVNQSAFLTDEDAVDELQVMVIDAVPELLVLFSDGLEDLLISPKDLSVHPPFFDYLSTAFGAAKERVGVQPDISEQLSRMLTSKAVTSRSDDDTSIVAIFMEASS